jgi:hypothetical protein
VNIIRGISVGESIHSFEQRQQHVDEASHITFIRVFNQSRNSDVTCVATTTDCLIISAIFSSHVAINSDSSSGGMGHDDFTCLQRCDNNILGYLKSSLNLACSGRKDAELTVGKFDVRVTSM